MISEDLLTNEVVSLLHRLPNGMPVKKIVELLQKYERDNEIELSCYGYVMHVIEHRGVQAFWSSVIGSEKSVKAYCNDALDMRDNIPELLVNAGEYLERVMERIPDQEMALSYVEGMTFPYVLYLLFEGAGQHLLSAKYLQEAEEVAKRYPSAFDKLTDSYREAGEKLVKQC